MRKQTKISLVTISLAYLVVIPAASLGQQCLKTNATPVSSKYSQVNTMQPITYSDGRGGINYRLSSKDQGVIFEHGHAPNGSDIDGARDVFVYKEGKNYYMTYDGASKDRWSVNEAVSTDLNKWRRLGTVLDKGKVGEADGATADYGTIYKDGDHYDMFYLGSPNQT